VTERGKYRLDDDACAQLLTQLAENDFANASPQLRAELLRFFSSPEAPSSAKVSAKARARLKSNVQKLENALSTPSAMKSANTDTTPQ
jgi:hypothetical protein